MTTGHDGPREIPEIPAGVGDDTPPPPTGSPEDARQTVVKTTVDSEADKHERALEKEKHGFARHIIWVTITLALVCGTALYLAPLFGADAGPASGLLDFFKIVATTALGFLFGRTVKNGGA